MFKIGYRTLKTALGTALAIYLAQLLHLQNFASAGIITILCIQITQKRSLQASWARFAACCLAILFSCLFFELIGYHPFVIGALLLLFIPTTVVLKINEGIVTSSVIILHLYMSGGITFGFVWNEVQLITIGIGVALLMNLYMPSLERKLLAYQKKIEDNFAVIFAEIERYLLTGEQDWTGKEIPETHQLIHEAKNLAYRDVQNYILRHENFYYHYFKMREKQFEIIERLLPKITSISITVEQGKIIAAFIQDLREAIHPGNTAHKFLKRLCEMRKEFEEMPLPVSREEFEARAALFHLLGEMEQYLVIKSYFKGIKPQKSLG
ncbi:aromatic acid exporter family protein [Bacillus atrophaeus]|uniref:aromatic acid exporter family protein n=1 Tax=Bacillus atrophaeus TaxID=1452 RepID=UPI002282260B|nr:aromatic acid exporter family protein [Bacillus atrophaeus]MCY8490540.1 aromatic acid exporter family protein [Bacillus atrophaeus]MCY8818288.1 aromatic acid exporter family protein [Bacillus atrophaeus]MEC0694516.1 aromatic acid exporter family protein [Bacillus atrophaeus]